VSLKTRSVCDALSRTVELEIHVPNEIRIHNVVGIAILTSWP
jgi:hypothetical protein